MITPADKLKKALRSDLLKYGGTGVSLARVDPELKEYTSRRLVLKGGKEYHLPFPGKWINQDCHGNAARLWCKHPRKYVLMTGYALSGTKDVWVPHTWLLERTTGLRVDRYPYEVYYGIILTDEEAFDFYELEGHYCEPR
jgi:hypothetical protein